MEFWEFLLQKEGDRSWLPLESPSVEILEGRYRIVARSSKPNSAIEIKVTQQDLYETPPVRRIQKRTSKTNDQGLVVIMPFTRLQPGDWELRCSSDLMDDMLGNGWNQSLQLQVLPVEGWQEENLTAAEGDAALEPTVETVLTAETAPTAEVAPPPSEQISEQIAAIETPEAPAPAEPIAASTPPIEALEIPAVPDAEVVPDIAEVEVAEFSESEVLSIVNSEAPIPLQLQLTQETWVMKREQPLILTGAIVQATEPAEKSALSPAGQLRVRLFDPQTSKMLFDQDYPVPSGQPLPYAFTCELVLPTTHQTYLVIGELALYGVAEPGALPPVLATQPFSVTGELHELLEAIANDTPVRPVAPQPKPSPLAGVDLSFLNLPPLQQTLLEFTEPPADSTQVHALDLPSFDLSQPYVPAAEKPAAAEIQRNDKPEPPLATPPETETPPASIPPASISPTSVSPSPTPPQPLELVDDLTADWDEAWDITDDGAAPQQTQNLTPATPEDHAFRSLNLQDRFLNRLQSLATDNDNLADWLREAPPKPSPHAPIDQEIVVDDEVLPVEPTRALVPKAIAIPEILLPKGDLPADQPFEVWIKLPKSATRTYAKLWVRDRQSRILIDGPRWLIDLKPDGFGKLRAQTMITLPVGCMDVQFEAIAIEMTTQSESAKVTATRSVLPPEYTGVSLEELDV